MVFVLYAPGGIYADRLQTTARRRRDAHVSPCRREDERAYALKLRGVADASAFVVFIPEAFLLGAAPPPPARALSVFDQCARRLCRRRLRAIRSRPDGINRLYRAGHPLCSLSMQILSASREGATNVPGAVVS